MSTDPIKDRIAKADAAIEASMERIRAIAAPARAALAQPESALSPAEALMQAIEGTLPKCRDCCHFRPGPNIGAGQGLCSHDSIGGSNLHGPSDWCRNWSPTSEENLDA
jgi:hypothetical protein